MRIGILGTGVVGATLGTKLAQLGHDVKMGSRSATNEKAVAWARAAGGKSSAGTFADAASHGEVVFNCTSGIASLEALKAAGGKNHDGKVLIDVANPLDFSKGMPPSLFITSTRDLLLSGTSRLHMAYRRAGVPADLIVFEALPHAFWNNISLPETKECFEMMAKFFDNHLK